MDFAETVFFVICIFIFTGLIISFLLAGADSDTCDSFFYHFLESWTAATWRNQVLPN